MTAVTYRHRRGVGRATETLHESQQLHLAPAKHKRGLSLWRFHLPPNRTSNSAFGRKIKELREAKKKTDPTFSLRQFAQAVGISPTFLSKIENGESSPPSAENIQKMAALLNCDADELLALAGRFDPALEGIITGQPKAMADLLRTAKLVGATTEDLEKLRRALLRNKNKG